MSINWTKQQIEAINAKGGNILVAAAAGSGKTAVLVERIIRIITDKENPVSIDKLLVLTFTNAAAAEMKRKIADAIDKKLEENPFDAWLREQSIKISSASISTIDAFCNRIISNNSYLTVLPSDFSLIDTTENELLRAKAIDAVLESYYSRIDTKPAFKELVLGWGGIKGDDSLRDIIIKLHNFTRSLAYPKQWLHNAYAKGYGHIKNGGSLETSAWSELISNQLYNCAVSVREGLGIIRNIVDSEVPRDHKYFIFYHELENKFCNELDNIDSTKSDFTERLINLFTEFKIGTSPRSGELSEDLVNRIKYVRDKIVKTELAKAASVYSVFDTENLLRISKCAPVVKILCSIVRQVEYVHQKYKNEKSVVDFNDLEHGLLRLLCSEQGKETPLCFKLREYYHEILVDEFQDVNSLQFEIFNHISKKEGNLFMVGDVKQCIYKFRNADPSIFMRLYKSYEKGEGGMLIRLFTNFRSRTEVISSTNYIFSSIMSEQVGDIDYTPEEYLIYGNGYSKNGSDHNTDVILFDLSEANKTADPVLKEFSKSEAEAQNAAEYIKNLIYEGKTLVTDKESGLARKARFSDITVLCRNRSQCNEVDTALSKLNIMCETEGGQIYLNSTEVSTVLSFLQIIDNPLQDIPLIAVMRSPIFGFCADELAKIRICAEGYFYNAVKAAASDNPKAEQFNRALCYMRRCAKYMGTDELVWKICNEFHYISIVGAMPNGDKRKANLKLLLSRCSEYEQGSFRGLFNFIKYIEILRESKNDMVPARAVSDNENEVKIMTVHKSKGLEFPIVFLFDTAKKFNIKDMQRSIIWDIQYGIGIDFIDTKQRVRFNVPIRRMIEDELHNQLKAEEIRLLYVAMTRAKEKLIISGSVSKKDNKWKQAEFDNFGRLYPVFSKEIMSMRDWIFSALMNSSDASTLRELAARTDIKNRQEPEASFKIIKADMSNIISAQIPTDNITPEKNDTAAAHSTGNIKDRLDYTYPYSELKLLPIKLSVSELKRRKSESEDFSFSLFKPPAGMIADSASANAAERGTITHFVLQHIDISKTDSREHILTQLKDMVSAEIISNEQLLAVDINAIYNFFCGSLGKRLKSAEKFEREFDFYMLVSANEVENRDIAGADDVILQGIADCFFYEPDGIVLIDYKTDRVAKTELQKRSKMYKTQIEYYSRGLEAILGLPIKEKYLYFLNCGEAVQM